MNHLKITVRILLVTATLIAPLAAAEISFSGYLLNRADWRKPDSPKLEPATNQSVDMDKDGILGTQGYVLFGPAGQETGKIPVGKEWLQNVTRQLPPWVHRLEILAPAEMGRFPGYAVINDPVKTDLSFNSGALILETKEPELPLLKITFGDGAPPTIRIGLMVDNLDNGTYNTRAFFAQTGKQKVGPIVTLVQNGSSNGIPDYYFFDVIDAKPGESVTFLAEPGPGGMVTLGGLTFDSVSPKHYAEFRHADRYLKDFYVYKNGDTYHLFYNIGLADGKQEWQQPGNEEMFGHATSKDLRKWEYHPGVLITQPLGWEEATVSAPSIVKRDDGNYYMAYTGFDRNANQQMGLAVSKDLFEWKRVAANPIARGPSWSSWQPGVWADFRDPDLFPMADGFTYMFNTVHVPDVGGAVAISRSKDLLEWEDLGPQRALYPGFHAAESARAFLHDGKVYVFIGGGGSALMVTDDIMSGKWEHVPFDFPNDGLWSGWEIVEGPEGQMLFCAFKWKMFGNFIHFWEVDWENGVPRLRR